MFNFLVAGVVKLLINRKSIKLFHSEEGWGLVGSTMLHPLLIKCLSAESQEQLIKDELALRHAGVEAYRKEKNERVLASWVRKKPDELAIIIEDEIAGGETDVFLQHNDIPVEHQEDFLHSAQNIVLDIIARKSKLEGVDVEVVWADDLYQYPAFALDDSLYPMATARWKMRLKKVNMEQLSMLVKLMNKQEWRYLSIPVTTALES